ncbi:glutamine amidotransferase [Bradyrhizobium prioriisuperbiae]|uniref:glutamine amidotransferase n=1 Tax=Bradyrhizobium prioriisuperbiae TaxID=2854389 RepID=UPI0028E7D5CF|nr:glutamine amidotransferase [Bradyrhizobium prioritasuperba]
MRRLQRTAVALRHVAFEDLGLLAPVLDRAGWTVSFCEAAVEDLSHASIVNADLLIVLGGPIGAYEIDKYPFLSREIALLERRLRKKRPTLGICLGSQLMAKALGSRVYAGAVKEIGWGKVELTEAGAASCLGGLACDDARVLHWHGDSFDLPEGAVRLASNAHYDNQAFAFGGQALGLQFHLEAEPRQLEEWYVGHAVELAAAGISVPELRTATSALAGRLRTQADSVFDPWLRQIGPV